MTPGPARSLKFQGYVQLPSRGWLSVLDYLTVDGRNLFVTSVTSGDVYKIALDSRSPPTAARIATLPGPPAAHGVAVDPASGLAFVTRSGANTVDVFDPARSGVPAPPALPFGPAANVPRRFPAGTATGPINGDTREHGILPGKRDRREQKH